MVATLTKRRKVPFEPGLFGARRRPKQFTLTLTAVELLEDVATELNTSGGTLVECLIRGGGMGKADPPDVRGKNLPGYYGENKDQKATFTLTDDASKKLTEAAEEKNTSRSEILESAIRNGGLAEAKAYYLSLG